MSELHDYGFRPPQSGRVKLGGSHPAEKRIQCVLVLRRVLVSHGLHAESDAFLPPRGRI